MVKKDKRPTHKDQLTRIIFFKQEELKHIQKSIITLDDLAVCQTHTGAHPDAVNLTEQSINTLIKRRDVLKNFISEMSLELNLS